MKTVLQAIFASALLAGTAFAQFGGPPGGPPGPPPPGGPHGRGAFEPGGFGPGMHGKVVKDAPYTATATNTFTQTLANGNSIQRTSTATVARDAAGRTYEQETITGGPLAGSNGPTTFIFLMDPVAGYSYVLNTSTKVATRRALHTPPVNGERPNAAGRPQRPVDPNVVESDLGTTVVNGVNATGKRSTHVIPAGTIGNTQDIKSTNETWISPDLQVVVSSKHDDPRTGTANYSLTNIQRAEPAATLFQVPADYTVQDAKGFSGRGEHGPRQ